MTDLSKQLDQYYYSPQNIISSNQNKRFEMLDSHDDNKVHNVKENHKKNVKQEKFKKVVQQRVVLAKSYNELTQYFKECSEVRPMDTILLQAQ